MKIKLNKNFFFILVIILLKLEVLIFSISFFEYLGNRSYLPNKWIPFTLLFLSMFYLMYIILKDSLLANALSVAILPFFISYFAIEYFVDRTFIFDLITAFIKNDSTIIKIILCSSIFILLEQYSFKLIEHENSESSIKDKIIDFSLTTRKGSNFLRSNYRFFYPHDRKINKTYGDIKHTFNSLLESNFGYDVYSYSKLNFISTLVIKNINAIFIDEEYTYLKNIYSFKYNNLEYIHLYKVSFIPKQVFDLKHLKVLIIESKNIKHIPNEIANLNSLNVLVIALGDNIEFLSPNIETLKNLNQLYLQRLHKIINYEIDFSKLPNLEVLEVSDSADCIINNSITACKKLNQLYVKEYKDYFLELNKLKLLSLGIINNDFEIKQLTGFNKLEELAIGSYELNYFSEYFTYIKNLRNLFINIKSSELQFNKESTILGKLECLSIYSKQEIDFSKLIIPNLLYLIVYGINKDDPITISNNFNKFKNLKYILVEGKHYKIFSQDVLIFSVAIKTGLWFEDKYQIVYKAANNV